MTSSECLSTNRLELFKGGKQILKPLSLSLQAGQLVALIGPNGAGKSSLLTALSDGVTDERVRYWQQTNWSAKSLSAHMAVLSQENHIAFPFTVEEIIELGSIPIARPKSMIHTLIQQLMQQWHLTDLKKALYANLSGGEKQRVHLARLLLQLHDGGHQKLLLLDEPTSAMDLSHQLHAMQRLKNYATEQHAGVLLAIHDLNLASQFADRLILLSQGELIADGSPDEVLTEANIDRAYQYKPLIIQHPIHQCPILLTR